MLGQWQGSFKGYATGTITVEVDEMVTGFSGRLCVFDSSFPFIAFTSSFRTTNKDSHHTLRLPISSQRIGALADFSQSELAAAAPGIDFPNVADIVFDLRNGRLKVKATTYRDTQTLGSLEAILSKGSAEKPSRLKRNRRVTTWEKFKTMVGQLETDRFVFRGQSVGFRLRTSFHRTNRRDLARFVTEDIPMLHASVTSKTSHYFDFRDEKQYAAFCNLLQHHGYPTPLLDWTYSPYVATFFAYREKLKDNTPKQSVRIFKFDSRAWYEDYRQIYSLVNVKPHFSLMNPVALENPRALPQQALCSITTVDDVESYLEKCGDQMGKNYLEVFELPYIDRTSVLADLRLMGVAAGSLFPGIDGACEEMKFKNFR